MSHNNNTRKKKESVVSSECLQTLKLISLIILSLKDEIISLKDTVIKRLQEENEGLCNKCQYWNIWWLLSNLLMMPLSNTVGGIFTDFRHSR